MPDASVEKNLRYSKLMKTSVTDLQYFFGVIWEDDGWMLIYSHINVISGRKVK